MIYQARHAYRPGRAQVMVIAGSSLPSRDGLRQHTGPLAVYTDPPPLGLPDQPQQPPPGPPPVPVEQQPQAQPPAYRYPWPSKARGADWARGILPRFTVWVAWITWIVRLARRLADQGAPPVGILGVRRLPPPRPRHRAYPTRVWQPDLGMRRLSPNWRRLVAQPVDVNAASWRWS